MTVNTNKYTYSPVTGKSKNIYPSWPCKTLLDLKQSDNVVNEAILFENETVLIERAVTGSLQRLSFIALVTERQSKGCDDRDTMQVNECSGQDEHVKHLVALELICTHSLLSKQPQSINTATSPRHANHLTDVWPSLFLNLEWCT